MLSPTTARYDRFTKRRLYQDMKVPLYWIVDSENRAAEAWTPDAARPMIERDRLVWFPAAADQAFVLELSSLFDF
ncbi:MAG: Uma2 family endonuclease [Gemmatimonadota bacterium]